MGIVDMFTLVFYLKILIISSLTFVFTSDGSECLLQSAYFYIIKSNLWMHFLTSEVIRSEGILFPRLGWREFPFQRSNRQIRSHL